jgi:hypothetical protein
MAIKIGKRQAYNAKSDTGNMCKTLDNDALPGLKIRFFT